MAPQVGVIVVSFSPPPPPPPQPPAWDPTGNPNGYYPKKHETTEVTETYTSTLTLFGNGPVSMTMPASATAMPESQTSGWPSATTSRPPRYQNGKPYDSGRNISSAAMGAAGAIATLVFLSLIAVLVFFLCCRKSRNKGRRDQDGTRGQEMVKTNDSPDTRAYMMPPATVPSPSIPTASASSGTLTQQEAPPVLLSTTIDQSYYTGIDTSDMVSVSENQRHSTADIYASSISEPPPPYRPQSSFSRNSSMRIPSARPPSYGPRLSVRSQREVIRSPFDDPEGDSPISETNESPPDPNGFRDMEEMSDVSELSYQQDPVEVRSSV